MEFVFNLMLQKRESQPSKFNNLETAKSFSGIAEEKGKNETVNMKSSKTKEMKERMIQNEKEKKETEYKPSKTKA